jgi:hypothetical protein
MPRFIVDGQRRAWDFYPKKLLNGSRTADPMIDFVKIALSEGLGVAGAQRSLRRFTSRVAMSRHWAKQNTQKRGRARERLINARVSFRRPVQLKPGLRVVNDNPAQETALLRAQEARLEAAALAQYSRERNRAIAGALGMLVLSAAQGSCDPTSPSCH